MTYEKGYFKALLDIITFVDIHSEELKSLRYKRFNFLLNLIKHLASNNYDRQKFMAYGGCVDVKYTDDCGNMKIK